MSSDALPDSIALSALLASRLCHDLINPVGALSSGVEVLEDPDMDPSMRDAALDLICSGGRKSVALLKYARLAYGLAGGRDAELSTEEAGNLLGALYEWSKADLQWRLPPGSAAKEKVKAALILGHAAADCVPRGGVVTIAGAADRFTVEAVGPRAILQPELVAALEGDATELRPKFTPAYIAGLWARERGGGVSVESDGEKVVFTANFTSSAALSAAR